MQAGNRRWLFVVLVLALACALAPAAAAKRKRPADVFYQVTYKGTGSFTSTRRTNLEGVGACLNAINSTTETDTLAWEARYDVKLPKTGEPVLDLKGNDLDVGATHWRQNSITEPPNCFNGSQDCTGDLFPASTRHPGYTGDDRRPEILVDVERKEVDFYLDAVTDFVVGGNIGGSGPCKALYSKFQTALVPFGLAHKLPGFKHLSVESAMRHVQFIPRSKLNAGKTLEFEVKQNTGEQPPANCLPFAFGLTSCSEQFEWKGTLTLKPS
jgi:hypothetical protein